MKIGLTGGTGFIGQYVLKQYAKEHQFFVITSREDIEGLYQHPNIQYIKADYNLAGFRAAFSSCDSIVHFGAKRSTKEREMSIRNYYENLESSEDLFNACVALGIKNVVNISSTAVYDQTLKCPYLEKYATAPLSCYGVVKCTIEGIAHLFNQKFGMHIKSLRVAQVLGIGERSGYMLSIFQEKCIKNEKLSVYGTGKAGREYIYVKDVARAVMCALKASEKSGTYNIGTGIFTSNLELAKTFCSVYNNIAGYELLLDKPDSGEHFLMDVSLAEQELGFRTKYTLEMALAEMKNMVGNKK